MDTILIMIFALLVILVVLLLAFRNAKPTNIYHGPVNNYYCEMSHSELPPEKPKSLIDDNVRQPARDAGDLTREFRGTNTSNERKLSE